MIPLSCSSYNYGKPNIFGQGNANIFSQKRPFSITFSTASTAICNLFLYCLHAQKRNRLECSSDFIIFSNCNSLLSFCFQYECMCITDGVYMHNQRSEQYHHIDFHFYVLDLLAGLQPQIRAGRLLQIQLVQGGR